MQLWSTLRGRPGPVEVEGGRMLDRRLCRVDESYHIVLDSDDENVVALKLGSRVPRRPIIRDVDKVD